MGARGMLQRRFFDSQRGQKSRDILDSVCVQSLMEMFERVQIEELLLWGNVKQNLFVGIEKMDDVC
jgi:hypothetical protein